MESREEPVLYGYFRSSAAYRVRIALNLKRVPHRHRPVHLGGGQHRPEYRALNPQGLVPALRVGDEVLTQSLAIIEFLEERHPTPPFLPGDAVRRARIRAFALAICCDLHPLNNLRVLDRLRSVMGQPEEAVTAWYRHWISLGLDACEALIGGAEHTAPFCFGEEPTLADVCLVPQVFNAERFGCDLAPYPALVRVARACNALPAFAGAHPSVQPDAA